MEDISFIKELSLLLLFLFVLSEPAVLLMHEIIQLLVNDLPLVFQSSDPTDSSCIYHFFLFDNFVIDYQCAVLRSYLFAWLLHCLLILFALPYLGYVLLSCWFDTDWWVVQLGRVRWFRVTVGETELTIGTVAGVPVTTVLRTTCHGLAKGTLLLDIL